MYELYIQKLYRENMNIRKGDRLLLLTDDEKDYLTELTGEFEQTAYLFTENVRAYVYTSTKEHGREPPEDVWRITFGEKAVEELKLRGLLERVLNKEDYSEEEVAQVLKETSHDVPTCIVAFAYFSTTHTFYRKVLTKHMGARYASMPLFHPDMFLGPMNVDWDYVAKLSMDIADMLTEAQWVHVRDAWGTGMEFSLEGREALADTGLFHKPGDYGNLPAGEAFIAPVETSAYGTLVIRYGPDRALKSPLKLKFKDGAVEEMDGEREYKAHLERVFNTYDNARRIAEFGVGTNPGAKRVDNVLEAEKILGTIHIAIGDNAGFGGTNRVPFHTDYVVFEPQVTVGGKGWQKRLLERGKLGNLS